MHARNTAGRLAHGSRMAEARARLRELAADRESRQQSLTISSRRASASQRARASRRPTGQSADRAVVASHRENRGLTSSNRDSKVLKRFGVKHRAKSNPPSRARWRAGDFGARKCSQSARRSRSQECCRSFTLTAKSPWYRRRRRRDHRAGRFISVTSRLTRAGSLGSRPTSGRRFTSSAHRASAACARRR